MEWVEQPHDDWIEQAHATAILDRLAAAPPTSPALMVYDGVGPADPKDLAPAYVLVYMYTTNPAGTSLTSDSDRAVTRALCHCVGPNAAAARAVAGRVRAALLDAVPTVPGRVCFPIRDDGTAQPPRRDESTGVPVMDLVVTYRLESVAG